MAVMDLNKYKYGFKKITEFAKNNSTLPIGNLINRCSQLGGQIPIVATAHFVGMAIGYTPEIEDTIKRLSIDYHYSEVIMLREE